MDNSLSNALSAAAAEMMLTEIRAMERLVAAYIEETGRYPHLIHEADAGRCWCDRSTEYEASEDDRARALHLAAEYRAETNIPASKAVLVRSFEGTTFSWRWEERR